MLSTPRFIRPKRVALHSQKARPMTNTGTQLRGSPYYMRMYWCKRLIEWTEHPSTAFEYACYLNDKYALDGVGWCFGAFDHPFFGTKIYGKVKKMTEQSLKRKPGIESYLRRFSREESA